MNPEIEHRLNELEDKINHLIKINHDLTEKLKEKTEENKNLKNQLGTKNNQLTMFQNKIKISKIAEQLTVHENAAELKEKIEEFIKEIERCIAYLSE